MKIAPAESAAERLIASAGISKPPVDLAVIAERLEVRVFNETLEEEISGILLCENGKRKIAVNSRHHRNRRRFTIAHELGHVCLHVKSDDRMFVDQRFYRDKKSHEGVHKEEIEANSFAASLLMPRRFIKESINAKIPITDQFVFKLSSLYEVSEQAMTLRLVKLGHIQPD